MLLLDKELVINICKFIDISETSIFIETLFNKKIKKYVWLEKANCKWNSVMNTEKHISSDNDLNMFDYLLIPNYYPSDIFIPPWNTSNYKVLIYSDNNDNKHTLSVKFTGKSIGGNRCIRSNFPFFRQSKNPSPFIIGFPYKNKYQFEISLVNYYEITISGRSNNEVGGCIAIGLAEYKFPLIGKMPGWDNKSYGYHSDDGKKHHCELLHSQQEGENFGPIFDSGDVVGCGLVHSEGKYNIFFTKNGKFIDYAFKKIDGNKILYPVIGIDSFSNISLNFGYKSFLFDISEFNKKIIENYKILKNISKISYNIELIEDAEWNNNIILKSHEDYLQNYSTLINTVHPELSEDIGNNLINENILSEIIIGILIDSLESNTNE